MKLFDTKINPLDCAVISEVIARGDLGFGRNVIEFETEFGSFSKKRHNIATNSASASAFMIFSYLKQIYGECDVYTTSLGFTSPAWAAKHFGHNLIFVDVNDELQFSIENYKEQKEAQQAQLQDIFWEPRPCVIMPVLYGGVSNIEGFDSFYEEKCHNEIIVVDSAHCVTPTIKSDFIFFSFHPYKPICTSDGGMISTNDSQANEYFRSYRNFGRKQVGAAYDITQEGFKFYMNNLNATIGLTQINRYKENLEIRKENFAILNERYELLPHDTESSYYFATSLTSKANSVIIKNKLSRHYPMLHLTEYYNNNQVLENLESLHGKILNLPLHTKIDF